MEAILTYARINMEVIQIYAFLIIVVGGLVVGTIYLIIADAKWSYKNRSLSEKRRDHYIKMEKKACRTITWIKEDPPERCPYCHLLMCRHSKPCTPPKTEN